MLGEVYEEYCPLRTVSNGGKTRSSRSDRAKARRKLKRKMRCERSALPQTDDDTNLPDCSLPGGESVASCGSGERTLGSSSAADITGPNGSVILLEHPSCTERHPERDSRESPPAGVEPTVHSDSSEKLKADTNRKEEIDEPVIQVASGDCRVQHSPASELHGRRQLWDGGKDQRLSRNVKQLFVRGDNVVLITMVPALQEAGSGDM